MALQLNHEHADGNKSERQLKLLVTVVNRYKSEFYLDLIQTLGANAQFVSMGVASTDEKAQRYLGINSMDKAVIFSVIPEEYEETAMNTLEDKFAMIKNGDGVAYSIPLSSVIGTSAFNFLSNNRAAVIG